EARLFEALLALLERLADRSPTVLVVEDLHWADHSTLDLLAFLVRNLQAGLLVVLTYRTDELARRHPAPPGGRARGSGPPARGGAPPPSPAAIPGRAGPQRPGRPARGRPLRPSR